MQQQSLVSSKQKQRPKQPYTTRTPMQKALEILSYENRMNYPNNFRHNNAETKSKHGGSRNGHNKSTMDKKNKTRKVSFSVQ